jgi:hypothetical protein
MLAELIEPKYHLPLRFLGGKEWMKIELDENSSCGTFIEKIPYSRQESEEYGEANVQLAMRLLQNYASTASSRFFLLTLSKAVAEGPKLFRPSFDQCLAFEHQDINLTFDDYHQPYQCVILEIPKEYRDRMKQQYKTAEAPKYVLVYKDWTTNVIAVTAWFGRDNIVVNTMSPKPQYETIEDALVANRKNLQIDMDFDLIARHDDSERGREAAALSQKAKEILEVDKTNFDMAEMVQRLGINFSMMMTILGTSVVGPIEGEDRLKKHRKWLHDSDPHVREKAKKFMASHVYLIEFKQKVTFFDIGEDERIPEDQRQKNGPGHYVVKPHWRKGHYIRIHFGPKLEGKVNPQYRWDRRKPVRVNKEFFIGDWSDTSVEYNPRKPK